ncbi:MAG TPA: DUF3090 family protein [Dehalococcoidia bacterium]|nr:DUF3090 family protein [Dehalococcoidia bacterium]
MERARHDFGDAVSIDAESIGRPGQRRFRLMVGALGRTAAIWMEKQQLEGIGDWFEETIERLDKDNPDASPDEIPAPFGAIFDVDLQATQIGLGYAEEESRFALQVFDAESARGTPAFQCHLTRGQCRVLYRKIAEVVAGGRPICPLCEMPMDPEGHVCPRSNGHARAGV